MQSFYDVLIFAATPVIVASFTWLEVIEDWIDFSYQAHGYSPAANEVIIGEAVFTGPSITSFDYSNRTRGSLDYDNLINLTTDRTPSQSYHVGNKGYNDLRHVLKTGGNTNELIDVSALTAARSFALQDRSMTLADKRASIRLGMIVPSLEIITPADSTPWYDITTEGPIVAANWTTLAPFLRALFGTVLGTTDFSVTSISTSGSPVVVTFANNAANNAFLLALNAEQLYHGSFVNFRTLTLTAPIGSLAAGTYGIQGISTGARTVTLTASNSGSSAAGTVRYYPFRQPDTTSIVNAYWFQVDDAVLRTVGGDVIPYFRVLDRIMKHKHTDAGHTHPTVLVAGDVGGATQLGGTASPESSTGTGFASLGDPTDSGTGAGTPRTGTTSRDRSLTLYKYLYGDTYVP